VWLSPACLQQVDLQQAGRLERLVRDDVKNAFFAQNQQKPFKFFSQIVHF